jgi:hypothetical protein
MATTEEQRLAVEIISTLVYVKRPMIDLLLRPAGVPQEIYQQYLYKRDDVTGRMMSKRQIAPLILDELARRGDIDAVLRTLMEIAAGWTSFHLANNEFEARATVQKAREMLDQVELHEAREQKQRELARREELARLEQERAKMFKQKSELLLMMFDAMARSKDPHERGYLLQSLVEQTLDLYDIPVVKSFTRNSGAEQIDGAFKLEGWHYIVECRWRGKLADIRELDGLQGQVDRSGKQTMGVFLSINGWSENVPALLKQNPGKSIILFDGFDLRCVLNRQADLTELLLAKLARLNLHADPAYRVSTFLAESNP